MNLKEKAKMFAIHAHMGQIRKSEPDKPMIIHPISVGMLLEEYGYDESVVAAGYLHDVVEDTKYNIEDIRKEYGGETSEKILLELLKDRMSESEKSILQISLNEAVKVAPLLMKKHLNALSLLFFINEMSIMGVWTRNELIEFIKAVVLKFTKGSSLTKIDYVHLEYNKCITKIEILKSG